MHTEFDVGLLAERVWAEVGYRPSFPRDLLQPVMETFDVAVVMLPKLSIAVVNKWWADRGRSPVANHRDRALRGCLLARRGHGWICVDGSLQADERQFAVVHEFAHFFIHYLEPRRNAISRFGEKILAVLDGERLPRPIERLSGVLQGVPLGPFEDFLGRDDAGKPTEEILDVETETDMLAMELLAPRDEVIRLTNPGPERREALQRDFGLPEWAAQAWERYVSATADRIDPWILGIERGLKKSS